MFFSSSLQQKIRASPSLAKLLSKPRHYINSTPPDYKKALYHKWPEYVENLEAYHPGGFHPVQLTNEFCQGRYRIIHKLGYGAFSTVWLARDSAANRYVSLKVVAANVSKNSYEARTLGSLREGCSHHAKPNARRTTAQLALGMAYIHSCGIVHGDIHMKNTTFKLHNLDACPVEQVYKHLGYPSEEAISRYDGKPPSPHAPPCAGSPTSFTQFDKPPSNETSIIDFGGVSFTSEARKHYCSPILLQPPEALLGEPVGQPADIWAFACAVFDMFSNKAVFHCGMPDKDDVLGQMVDTLGRFPKRWWSKWQGRSEYYEEDGRKKLED